MNAVAKRKLHVAPWVRQERMIRKLVREGKFRNPTEFIRRAIDHYLDQLGHPSLSEQAKGMAREYHRASSRPAGETERLQDASRASDERW